MKKDKLACGQVNVPTVDNTELECDSFISSKCVKIDYPFIFLKGEVAPSLYVFFENFDNVIKDIKKSYTSLKQENYNLKQQLKTHETDINFLKKRTSDLEKQVLKIS